MTVPHHQEVLPPPSGEGTAVVDIGGTRGALVVVATAGLSGAEIEIRPVGRPWDGRHTAVRARHLRDGVVHAGLFGSLEAGPYELRLKGDHGGAVTPADVVGGEVGEVTWPAAVTH